MIAYRFSKMLSLARRGLPKGRYPQNFSFEKSLSETGKLAFFLHRGTAMVAMLGTDCPGAVYYLLRCLALFAYREVAPTLYVNSKQYRAIWKQITKDPCALSDFLVSDNPMEKDVALKFCGS